MPPTGFKKLKRKTKQEMLVTTRLMAISLLVDDYIYKNKTIPLLEARKMDEEITSLKLKCKQDPRTLQVVEKLKLFMKSIIKEQSMENLQVDSTSFVTESCVINTPLTNFNFNSLEVKNNITSNFTNFTTTKLFSNRETRHSQINNINNQKKMSVNIISDSNSDLIPVNTITANNSNLKLNSRSEENIKDVSKNIDFNKNNVLTKPTTDKEQAKQDSANLTSNFQKHIEQENKCIVQENQKSNYTTGTKNVEKQTKANKNTHTQNKTTAKKNIKTNTKKDLSKEPEKKSAIQSKKKPKEKTQINFSWVENIKFVREVSPDEHTDLLVEDSFWSNLFLPEKWDSNDFD